MLADRLDPRGDLLLVRPEPETAELGSGLVAPETRKKEMPVSGEIVKTGPEAHPAFVAGRRVVFAPLAGQIVGIPGTEDENLLLLEPSRVLAFLERAL